MSDANPTDILKSSGNGVDATYQQLAPDGNSQYSLRIDLGNHYFLTVTGGATPSSLIHAYYRNGPIYADQNNAYCGFEVVGPNRALADAISKELNNQTVLTGDYLFEITHKLSQQHPIRKEDADILRQNVFDAMYNDQRALIQGQDVGVIITHTQRDGLDIQHAVDNKEGVEFTRVAKGASEGEYANSRTVTIKVRDLQNNTIDLTFVNGELQRGSSGIAIGSWQLGGEPSQATLDTLGKDHLIHKHDISDNISKREARAIYDQYIKAIGLNDNYEGEEILTHVDARELGDLVQSAVKGKDDVTDKSPHRH